MCFDLTTHNGLTTHVWFLSPHCKLTLCQPRLFNKKFYLFALQYIFLIYEWHYRVIFCDANIPTNFKLCCFPELGFTEKNLTFFIFCRRRRKPCSLLRLLQAITMSLRMRKMTTFPTETRQETSGQIWYKLICVQYKFYFTRKKKGKVEFSIQKSGQPVFITIFLNYRNTTRYFA